MNTQKCKMYGGGVKIKKGKAQLARRAPKRPDRNRYLDGDVEPPSDPKRKCLEPLPADDRLVRPPAKTEFSNGFSPETKLPEDQTLRFASHIKLKQNRYWNVVIPVLPLVFAQVKHA